MDRAVKQWFVLDVNPEPWAIGPVGAARRGGKIAAYVGQNRQLKAYQEAIAESLKADYPDLQPVRGRVRLEFFFWRNIAEYKSPQDMVTLKHHADLTNLQKATEDALQGILFPNDKTVNDIRAIMVEQGSEVRGQVVISIETSPEVPEAVTYLPDHVYILMQHLDEPAKQLVLDYDDSPEEIF